MRIGLSLVLLMATIACPAVAQVEPRVAGDWQLPSSAGEPSKLLHIESDGRYRSFVNGQCVDTGMFTANNSNWSLKSDSGKSESGSFSMLGGNLKLHGGPFSGSWAKSSGAPSHMISTPTSPASSYSSSSRAPAVAPASSSQPWYAPSGSAQIAKPEVQPSSDTVPKSQTYSSMFRNGQRPELPGYNAPQPQAVQSTYSAAADAAYEAQRGSINSMGKRRVTPFDFDKWSAVQQMNRGRQGPQVVPRGGYIPVMKDNKARRFFQGF